MADTNTTNENEESPELEQHFLGLLAEFEGPDQLVEGCDKARRAGYKKMDAFSPFPIHGIDDAIGIKKTKLPLMVFGVGMTACLIGIALQFYTNGYTQDSPVFPGYPFLISGKAMFSLPANIPVTFEVIVLLSAFTAFFGMWALNGLPKLSNPLFRNNNFRTATSHGFFLYIEKGDGSFNETSTESELQEWGADRVERIEAPEEELSVPSYFKLTGLIVAALILVPPVVIFRAQYTKNPLPRMHVNPDMDRQYRGETQDESPMIDGKPMFADKRVMRKDPVGTIARGELGKLIDHEFFHGVKAGSPISSQVALVSYVQDSSSQETAKSADGKMVEKELDWITEFPEQIAAKLQPGETGEEFYKRGKQRFDIYCSVCHGYAGYGDGHVSQRGMALNIQQKAEWVQAKSLYDPKVMANPVGRIFDTITNGRGAMGPYRSQITAEDRWAIVFFVKSLQMTRVGEKSDAPDARWQAWEQVSPEPATAEPAKAESGDAKESGKKPGTQSETNENKQANQETKGEQLVLQPNASALKAENETVIAKVIEPQRESAQ